MKKIEFSRLSSLYEAIAAAYELYLPVKNGNQTNFKAYHAEEEVDLCAVKTVKSPKDAFFPQSETLYAVRKDGKRLEVVPKELRKNDFVIFGIRACDVKGIEVLDNVFLKDYKDTYYEARREHGILVTLACSDPADSCFCTTFGIDPAEPAGDVSCFVKEHFLYWKPLTDKGMALTEAVKDLFAEADEEDAVAVAALQTEIREIMADLPGKDLSLEGWGGAATETRFGSPVWDTLYKGCLACGTCTFVCPTCQCYDIKDYDTGSEIQRYRCWDSCMYSDFTLMAAANNRNSQMQRFRQRFMHKLVYYPANNGGMYGCVGCGRCVEKCPAHANIVKVLRAFAKEDAKKAAEENIGKGEKA